MDLVHNQVFKIDTNHASGFFRVIVNAPHKGCIVLVKIDDIQIATTNKSKAENQNPKKKLKSKLIWVDQNSFEDFYQNYLRIVEIEPDGFLLNVSHNLDEIDDKTKKMYTDRKEAMAGFLDLENLQKYILDDKGLGGLVKNSVDVSSFSRMQIYKLFSLLCARGFSELSLLPRFDRCGAPGSVKPCDGQRQKAGRKTEKERIDKASGIILPPSQPGMSTEWRDLILAADSRIALPKPSLPQRCNIILGSNFVQRYQYNNGILTAVDLEIGQYPNDAQIRRVIEQNYTDIERATHKTTVNNFIMNHRGITGKNWEGVGGPGHTWAIDSTVGDIYLRSSCNRAWIMGRPIVYVIVDVWSTAVLGFYVCFSGPSWAQAKVAIYSAACDPAIIDGFWGHETLARLNPLPSICHTLLCDRGEYLSIEARETAVKLIERLSYTPPYRGDLKGGVEVLHRIEKEEQFQFIPGAIDARRAEYELRKFNPIASVMTLPEYVAYLNILFFKYNSTADRSDRLDAHMKAAGVDATPAGLWHWGHSIGIGFRKLTSNAELITSLLPSSKANITKNGVKWAGAEYHSEVSIAQDWACHARNYGSKPININYFPGSLQKIWTPNESGKGLLELNKSDYSGSSGELSLDEISDAQAFALSKKASSEHDKTLIELKAMKLMDDLVKKSKALTEEADANFSGTRPSMTEAKAFEKAFSTSSGQNPNTKKIDQKTKDLLNESAQNHSEMMESILQTMNEDALL